MVLKNDHIMDVIAAMSCKEQQAMKEINEGRSLRSGNAVTQSPTTTYSALEDTKPSADEELNDHENIRNSICTWMFKVRKRILAYFSFAIKLFLHLRNSHNGMFRILKVVDYYNFDRETIYIGMSYLERYVIRFNCPSKKEYQLVAIAALYLAVKVHDSSRSNTLDVFVQLAGGKFTAEDIKDMEANILQGLDWKFLNPVTPQACAYHILTLLNDSRHNRAMQVIHEVANYIIEVMLLSGPAFDELRSRSCTIAFASVLVSLEGVRADVLKPDELSMFYSKMRMLNISSDEELKWMTQIIKSLLSNPSKGSHLDLNEIRLSLDGNEEIYCFDEMRG